MSNKPFYCGRCGRGRTAVRGELCFKCKHPKCRVIRDSLEGLDAVVKEEGAMVVSALRVFGPDHPTFDTRGKTYYELEYFPTLKPAEVA